jgi:hypothetical protein
MAPNLDDAQYHQLMERIGWQVDQVVSLDTPGKGIVPALYKEAVSQVGGPLCMTAAQELRRVVSAGDVVGLITGFPSRSFLGPGISETDGPVGAAFLARVIEETLGGVPILITEPSLVKYSEACLLAAGLLVTDVERALRSKRGQVKASAAGILHMPTADAEAQQVTRQFFEAIQPKALIAVEMPSRGADGYGHTASGRRIVDEYLAKADYLFHWAPEYGTLRIGLGDGGNEMGLGNLKEALYPASPVGRDIAAITHSDVPVVGASSNWAAYGIGACLEALSLSTKVLHRIDLASIIRRCAEAGAIDGGSLRPEPRVDGTPLEMNTAVVDLIAHLIEQAISKTSGD